MLNIIKWFKGTRVEIVMEIPLNCSNPLFELHVTGITLAGTTWIDGGGALQEAEQVQQWLDLSCLWCPGMSHSTSCLLSQVTTRTDGAPILGPKWIYWILCGYLWTWYRFFTVVVHKLEEWLVWRLLLGDWPGLSCLVTFTCITCLSHILFLISLSYFPLQGKLLLLILIIIIFIMIISLMSQLELILLLF